MEEITSLAHSLFLARTKDLVTQTRDGETLVFDLERSDCHVLNAAATIVWKHCDGARTVEELASCLAAESELPAHTELVELALRQLVRAHLVTIVRGEAPSAIDRRVSRRQLLGALGLSSAAFVLLPLVDSIQAPFGLSERDAAASMCVTTTVATRPPKGSTTRPPTTIVLLDRKYEPDEDESDWV